jgi:glycosyltransferase 2 family protein
MEQNDRKKRRHFWLGMLISLACLVAIFFFIEPAEILQALANARYGYLTLAGAGVVAFLMIRAVRWRFMLGNDAPWTQVFHIQNIGYFLTFILPFRLGDVARALLIGNVPPITIARGISTMVVERILDLLFIITLLPFTLASVERLPAWLQDVARFSGFAAVGAIVLLIIAANQRPFAARLATALLGRFSFLETRRWVGRLDSLLAGLDSLTRPRDGFLLVILSILTWLPILFAYHMGLLAVNLSPTLAMSAFVVCVAAFSVAAPSSPGQVGVFHAGVIAALELLRQPHAEAASFAFLYHALNLVSVTILGLIGIYGTGATFSKVVASTRAFVTAGNRSAVEER